MESYAAARQSRHARARSGRRMPAARRPAFRWRRASRRPLGVKIGDRLTFDCRQASGSTANVTSTAQGRLGQLPREFLRAVRARALDGLPPPTSPRFARRRPTQLAIGRSCSATRTSCRSTSAKSSARCRRSSSGSRVPSSSCSCSRSPAACWCCRRRSRRRRTSAISTRRSCARSARRSAQLRGAHAAEFLLLGALSGLRRRGGGDRDRLAARRSRFQHSVRGNPLAVPLRHRRRCAGGADRRLAGYARDVANRRRPPAPYWRGPIAPAHEGGCRKICIRMQSRGTICTWPLPDATPSRRASPVAVHMVAHVDPRLWRDRRPVARRRPDVHALLGGDRPSARRRVADHALSGSRAAPSSR